MLWRECTQQGAGFSSSSVCCEDPGRSGRVGLRRVAGGDWGWLGPSRSPWTAQWRSRATGEEGSQGEATVSGSPKDKEPPNLKVLCSLKF